MKGLLLLTSVVLCCFAKQVRIQSQAGTFIGLLENVDGRKDTEVAKFLGVPYAEAPTGERRFNKPVPKATLDAPYDASYFRPACKQGKTVPMLGVPTKTSENCLYLNIYAPHRDATTTPTSESYPVMVWINGVGFFYSYANPYVGDTLSTFGEVIVVTINYRLSIWGFASTGDDNLPGNYGLWDQHMAIQWVHDNIAAFGGDTSRVTLFGESAGAASVSYQGFFPGNKRLIHRVIAQSGSLLCSWAFNSQPRTSFDIVSKAAGCVPDKDASTDTIVACMRRLSENDLILALTKVNDVEFSPVLDGSFVAETPDNMGRNSLKSSDAYGFFRSLDWLSGINSAEGFFVLATQWIGLGHPETFTVSRKLFDQHLINVANYSIGNDAPPIVKKVISEEYVDPTDPNNATILRDKFIQMFADTFFIAPQLILSNYHAIRNKKSKTFLYRMDFNPSVNTLDVPTWGKGMNHAGELPFVFGFDKGMVQAFPALQGQTGKIEQDEVNLSRSLMKSWSNFAKSGDPNSPEKVEFDWPEYTADTKEFINIRERSELTTTERGIYARTVFFWSRLLPSLKRALTLPFPEAEVKESGPFESKASGAETGSCGAK